MEYPCSLLSLPIQMLAPMPAVFRLRSIGALLLSLCLAPAAHAQLGAYVGANFNRLSDIEINEGDGVFDNRTGWHAEVFLDFDIGPVGVRPGLRYMDAGQLYDDLRHDDDSNFRANVSVNMLEVPLNLRLNIGQAPAVNPYIIGGPVLRFPLTNDDELNDDLEAVGIAAGLGFGLDMNLGGIRLYPEILYTFGISRFVDDEFTIRGRTFSADEAQYLNAAMVRIGIGL